MKFIQLMLLSTLVGACFSPPKDTGARDKADTNKQSIQAMEARIAELSQRLSEADSANTQSVSSQEIEQLRAELTELMEATTRLQEQRFDAIENRMENLQVSINANTANLAELSLLRQQVNEEAVIENPQVTVNIDALSGITARLEALENHRLQMQAQVDSAIQAAERRWREQLDLALAENSGQLTGEMQDMILAERERLQIEQAQMQRQIDQIERTQQSIYSSQARLDNEVNEIRDDLDQRDSSSEALTQIRAQMARIETRMQSLENIPVNPGDEGILSEISRRMYEPCYNELAQDNYCLSQAAAIRRLGGEFINPMRFDRDRAGLLSYLAMSGVSLSSLMDNIDNMITPGSDNTRALFARCMEEDNLTITHLIAPQRQWPRLVILGLVMEKAEASLEALKDAGEVSNSTSPVTHFVAWWRSECYQRGLSPGSDGQSDHVHGAALDLSFAAQPNKDTFEFYKEFIRVHFWENDTFGVLYPLQAADLTMRIGVGLGHGIHNNGQMHLGLFSEEDQSIDNRMQWTYGSSAHGAYEDTL